jgi:hypothetical protein
MSKKTRSPTAMRPSSGITIPAMQSSTVVFPAPEGPNKMVNPGSALNSTCNEKSRPVERKPLRIDAVKFAG